MHTATSTSIVWFRLDLRIEDNPALTAAAARGAVVPVFIWAPDEESPWPPGGASRWWLHQSLKALAKSLGDLGSDLVIRRGPTLAALKALAEETGAASVFWNRRYEPGLIARDQTIKEALRAGGMHAESFNSALLHEPWTIRNQSGQPFQVFTPFWKRCLVEPEPAEPLPAPGQLVRPQHPIPSVALDALQLEPTIPWANGFRDAWNPGESGAVEQLSQFLRGSVSNYAVDRDRPDLAGTSRLSPHLHYGEIGPRQIWHALRKHRKANKNPDATWRHSRFLTEIGWREFSHHLLHHFPHTPTQPLRAEFSAFPWRSAPTRLLAWQKGHTGYPIVDAGMRQLWAIGWMHNRVRMIVASFLVKDLLIGWTAGARWFWDTLVDADLAQNTLGWQWTAGCGADAAPYFRVFNPILQGEKFDPNGQYVRRWCPEVSNLPNEWLHQPFNAPADVLSCAGVKLGRDYPLPIVDHATARRVALKALETVSEIKRQK